MYDPIPPFTRHGLLPDGIYQVDLAAFCGRFLDDFPQSRRRPEIMAGFLKLRSDAITHLISAVQWVDGSFVEDREPRDVDVVHFVDVHLVEKMNARSLRFIDKVLDGRAAAKVVYQTHCFFVLACRPGHPYFNTYRHILVYWRKWFGNTRSGKTPDGQRLSSRKKGFIRLHLGEAQKLPFVPAEVPDGR